MSRKGSARSQALDFEELLVSLATTAETLCLLLRTSEPDLSPISEPASVALRQRFIVDMYAIRDNAVVDSHTIEIGHKAVLWSVGQSIGSFAATEDNRAFTDYVFEVLESRQVDAHVDILVNLLPHRYDGPLRREMPTRPAASLLPAILESTQNSLLRIADQKGTPFYAYSAALVAQNARRVRALLPDGVRLLFAVMANDNPRIIRLLHDVDVGMFAGSDQNLQVIRQAHAGGHGVVFAPTGLTETSYNLVRSWLEPSLVLFANSIDQWRTATSKLPDRPVGIRLQAQRVKRGDFPSGPVYDLAARRIGIARTQLEEMLTQEPSSRGRIAGLHVYLGTDVQAPDILLPAYETIFEAARLLGSDCVLDLGGGLPSAADVSPEDPSWFRWKEGLQNLLLRHGVSDPQRVCFEFGRTLIADTAVFVTTVLDVRQAGNKEVAICDSTVGLWPRPYTYASASGEHGAFALGRTDEPADRTYLLAGCTTFSGDLLLAGAHLPRLKVGDRIALSNAGAYCASMSSRFLGAAPPREFLLRDSEIEDITPRKAR